MQFNPSDELETGARYLHRKTGVVWTVAKVGRIHGDVFSVIIQDPDGNEIKVPPGVLISETLYSEIETEDAEPVGILPIGSLEILDDDPPAITPPAALRTPDPENEPELIFKRPGRPRVEPINFDSYFGEPKKLGPKKKL